MTDEPITWYVSRRVDVPLRAATAAFDDLVEPVSGPGPARLAGALTVDPTTARPGIERRLHGRLSPAGLGGPVRIELELVPWSDRCVELGLRPARRPPRYRAARYFSAAVGALEELRRALHAGAAVRMVPPAPVRRAS
jgi:hypothetical protein